MPRNVSDIYVIPPGTEGFPDTTIESAKYNTYVHDVEEDLNRPRPIIAGGTGANDADEALANLGAEKSSQQVSNYDTHLFKPGSFYSTIGASGAPPLPAGQTGTHAFVGWVVSSDVPADPPANQNVVVHARNQNDITVPGRVYVREKKAGVWGVWSIDGTGIAGPTPPAEAPDGLLWWDSESGQLFVWYNDGNTKQWVIASPSPDPAQFLLKAGDKMEGLLELQAPPVADLDAANKKYVDDNIQTAAASATAAIAVNTAAIAVNTAAIAVNTTAIDTKVAKAGDTMSGNLTASIYFTSHGTFASTWGAVELAVTPPGFVYFRPQGYGNVANQGWIGPDGTLLIGGASALKPGGGSWSDSSDARIKTVHGDYTSGLAQVAALMPKRYSFKANYSKETSAGGGKTVKSDTHSGVSGKEFIGVVAQEAETAMPEMVTLTSGYIDGVAVNDIRVLDNSALVYALVNSCKELKARVESLEARLESLEGV